jgi:hypothetical protein
VHVVHFQIAENASVVRQRVGSGPMRISVRHQQRRRFRIDPRAEDGRPRDRHSLHIAGRCDAAIEPFVFGNRRRRREPGCAILLIAVRSSTLPAAHARLRRTRRRSRKHCKRLLSLTSTKINPLFRARGFTRGIGLVPVEALF